MAPMTKRVARPRQLRLSSVAVMVAGCAATAAWLLQGQPSSAAPATEDFAPAFLVTTVFPQAAGADGQMGRSLLAARDSPERAGKVVMHLKSGRWNGGVPNKQEIERRRVQTPQVNNMKDQYFIIWVRSQMVRQWHPINIISGSEAAKTLKNVKESSVAKAVGGDKLADYQIVRAIGMQLYEQKDEVKKQAVNMHPSLSYAKNFEYGYKEILNNTKFNDNPGEDMQQVNISLIPPEAELRNLLDDAGDAFKGASDGVAKVGDNIKGFLSGDGR